MGDSAIVFTSMAWLISNALLLSFMGFADYQIDFPSDPNRVATDPNAPATNQSGFKTFLCVAAPIAGGVFGGAGAAFLSFGTGAIVGAAIGAAAAVVLIEGTITGCSTPTKIVRFVTGIVDYALNLFGFLFQLLTFQIPRIPFIMNALIVLPPGIALGYIGLKTIRGAGG